MASTVIVCCKLPSGLHLDLMETTSDGKPTNTLKKRVTVNGVQAQRVLERANDKGVPIDLAPSGLVLHGYGITHVDKDFWEAWLFQNQHYPPVARGLIFAHDKIANAEAEAKEKGSPKAGIKSGMEPIDPAKPGAKIKPDERHTGEAA